MRGRGVGIGAGACYNNVEEKGHGENDRIAEGLGNAMNKNDIGGRFPPVCPFIAWMAAMGLGLAAMPAPAPAQEPGRPGGYSPEEARGRMGVPEGVHVGGFARQPLNR